jgi:hypothetical protein
VRFSCPAIRLTLVVAAPEALVGVLEQLRQLLVRHVEVELLEDRLGPLLPEAPAVRLALPLAPTPQAPAVRQAWSADPAALLRIREKVQRPGAPNCWVHHPGVGRVLNG